MMSSEKFLGYFLMALGTSLLLLTGGCVIKISHLSSDFSGFIFYSIFPALIFGLTGLALFKKGNSLVNKDKDSKRRE